MSRLDCDLRCEAKERKQCRELNLFFFNSALFCKILHSVSNIVLAENAASRDQSVVRIHFTNATVLLRTR